jgi:hypothetical protein
MHPKTLAAMACLAASASAYAVGPGSLGTIDNTLTVVSNQVPAGVLFDNYAFDLADPGALYGSAAVLTVPGVLDLPFFSVVLQDAAQVVLGSDANPGDGFTFAGLLGGSYTLTFIGLATGSAGGAYSATLYAQTAPVPEPETLALMLAGLGIVGFVRRRRSEP